MNGQIQYDKRNITMMMDLYELTMANGYFVNGDTDRCAVFDVFFRRNPDQGGYSIFAGLEQVLEYLEGLHFDAQDIAYLRELNIFADEFLQYLTDFRFTGDVYAFPEGTVMYPHEPFITIVAPLIEGQLIETAILNQINHQSLIATKGSRIAYAAKGRPVSDMGARRAHNVDAAVYGARAAYIGGISNTSTVLAGQMFDIPVVGTMAHSWIMSFPSEYDAFKRYAEIYPDQSIFLVDTYNTLESGVPNAIKVANDILKPLGKYLRGIRIDSGDLAYLSKRIRKMLDDAGMEDCFIVGSNSLDEFTITSILEQGGCIDRFGVGERLITSQSNAAFGAVYKLVSIEVDGMMQPRIKMSDNVGKITNPAQKKVFRVYDADGRAIADLLTLKDEQPDLSKPYVYIDPLKPWKKREFKNCTLKELQQQVMRKGVRLLSVQALSDLRDYVQNQLEHEMWMEERRFENPHIHYMDMSEKYYEMKMELLKSAT